MEATMFTTPTCGYCISAKSYLSSLGVKVKEIDVTKDQRGLEEMMRKSNQAGVPVILLKGSTIVGFDKNRIDRLLNVH